MGGTNAPRSYAAFSYALSHEIGEWADDLLVDEPTTELIPHVVNGFTYNLQDLVTLPYFGAPPRL